MKIIVDKIAPYALAIVVFVIISLAYFSPVLEGKKIFQNDIKHFTGMAKEVNDFRKANDAEPYWTNAAFGGMPTYNLSVKYPNNYIKKLDKVLRFLPRPADYLFLYLLSFFILLSVLKVEYKLAILGALAFGFSTYYIIILGVGHNAKAHAIAYMPMVLAGILMVLQHKYLWGFILTAIAMALEINTGHPQMTYYLLFMVLILGVVYLINAFKEKQLPSFIKSIGILIVAVILSVGVNATSLLATKEYAKYSTRGKSELTINPDGSTKKASNGLSKDYITTYSYGIPETFNLMIPRFMGGGNYENVGFESNIYNFLKDKTDPRQAKQFTENAPMYWGKQPIVEAPAYIGAILVFLFVLGIFLVKGKLKKWLVAAVIFSILLSWGKNLNFLTDFFIDYVPMYNKFRAVSSIQVIAELAIPLLGILALKELFSSSNSEENKLKSLKNATYIIGGIALVFTLFGSSLLDHFSNSSNFEVIFTTGLKDYKEKAMDYFAFYYLNKPILKAQLVTVIDKFLSKQSSFDSDKYFAFKNQLQNQHKKISLPMKNGDFCIIDIDDIIYCEADGSYTHFYATENRTYITSNNLKKVENILQHTSFFRIHRSILLNLKHISQYNNSGEIKLSNNQKLLVASRNKSNFLRVLKLMNYSIN